MAILTVKLDAENSRPESSVRRNKVQIGDKVPDEKTIWLFKEQLKEKQFAEDLFNLFTGQLLEITERS